MRRIEALDFARVVAMLSVIMIHVTSTFIYNESNFMVFNMNLAFVLNQASRHAVPLFILISGLSIGLSQKPDRIIGFWKKRILKIGPPYMIWFFIYELYNYNFDPGRYLKELYANPSSLAYSLLLGQSAPHLYFIIILIQLYLLYPIVEKILSRSSAAGIVISFLSTHLIQSLYHFKKNGLDLIPDFIQPYLWVLFPTWLFYFVLGVAISKGNLKQVSTFAVRNRAILVGGTMWYSVLFVIDAHLTQSLDSIKQPLNLYVILVFLCTLGIWEIFKSFQCLRKTLLFLSRHSMSIYFSHVLILCYYRKISWFTSGMVGMLSLFIAVLITSIVVSLVIDTGAALFKNMMSRT